MSDNLKQKTIVAILWSGVEKVGIQVIQFVISIIIARILFPRDYGLIAMLAIFFAVSSCFIEGGFSEALVQKKTAGKIDFSTIFFFNIGIGLLAFLLLFVFAPLIAKFFNEPKLVSLTRFMALNLIISSFGLIQNTKFRKNIDFKSLAKVRLISIGLSGIIGIVLAYKGFGVWSLAIQAVINNLSTTLLLWTFSKWYPTIEFSFQSLKDMFPFGSRLFAAGLLWNIFENIYSLVIGKCFSAADLGFYAKAKQLHERPGNILTQTIGSVTFPVFSSIQDDNARLKAGSKKMLKMIAFANFPMMLGLIVIAEPLIKVLLTDKWLQAVIYIKILSLQGLVHTIHYVNLNILKSKGRSDLYFNIGLIGNILVVMAIIIGLKWGVLGLVVGRVIVGYMGYCLSAFYSARIINYSIREQLSDMLPYLFISISMAVLIYLIGFSFSEQPLIKLVIQISFGAGIYFLLAKMFRLEAFEESFGIFKMAMLKLKTSSISG